MTYHDAPPAEAGLTERAAGHLNAALPRAKPPCPRCRGTGHYYDPPEAVQRREAAEGRRAYTCGRTCECILPDVPGV